MRSGWLGCLAVACALTLLVSCGSSGRSTFLYLTSAGTDPGTIAVYSLNLGNGLLNSSNGALTPTGKTAATGTQPGPMIFNSTHSFAYVADFGNPLAAGTDNTKKTGDIAALSINKNGSITSIGLTTPAPDPSRPQGCTTLNPIALATDAKNQFLFVASQQFYNAGSTCPAQPANGTPAPGVISVFSVASGKVTAVASTPLPVPAGPAGATIPLPTGIAVSNQGSFVYITDSTNNTVVGFAYDSSGNLTSIPGQFVPVGTTPRAVFSPPAGNFLYVGNAASNDVYEFTINTDGSLVAIMAPTTIVPTGVGPIAMLSDPNAKYVYVLSNGGSQISGYTLNKVTGALTAIGPTGGTISTGANPVSFTIRSDGSTNGNFWVFTSNLGANSVSSYALNGATGQLSALPQLSTPVAPYGIATR
jgi:6-phosphogluconolactonase (cycloisomerase 2 family)